MNRAVCEVTQHDGIAVATLRGDIDVVNVPSVTATLREHVRDSVIGLVVDLGALRYLDSAGMQMLFQLAKDASIWRKGMAVALPKDAPLTTLFRVTGFAEAATVRDTLEDCLDVLRSGEFLQY